MMGPVGGEEHPFPVCACSTLSTGTGDDVLVGLILFLDQRQFFPISIR